MNICYNASGNFVKDYFYLLEEYPKENFASNFLKLKSFLIYIKNLNLDITYVFDFSLYYDDKNQINIVFENIRNHFLIYIRFDRHNNPIWRGHYENTYYSKSNDLNKLIEVFNEYKKDNDVI